MSNVNIVVNDSIENIVINDSTENIIVSIDDKSPNLPQLYDVLQNINLLYSLSAKSIETINEMDTLQENLSAKWHETYEIVDSGAIVADGGFF